MGKVYSMKPILIHCHIFYPELWAELKQCILNVSPYPFEIFVTMVQKYPDLEKDILKTFPKAHIEVVANRGYDIGPFIYVLNKINLDKYSYVIKLHTKRDMPVGSMLGLMNVEGKKWREYALSFLKNPETFDKTIKAFMQNKKLGMHGDYHLIMDQELYDEESAQKAQGLISKLKFKNRIPTFVAGTMFMVRSQLLKPVQDLKIKISNFERPDNQHRKTTFAHVIERFFGYLVGAQSYAICDVASAFQYRGWFWNKIRKLGLFLYRRKLDKKGNLRIRLLFLTFLIKENGRVRVLLLGVKIFSFKKSNSFIKTNFEQSVAKSIKWRNKK